MRGEKQSKIKAARNIYRALDHKLRLKLLLYINKNPGTYVKSIYKTLRQEQSVTSHHLKILRDEGILTTLRDGKNIKYFINYERLKQIQTITTDFIKLINKK